MAKEKKELTSNGKYVKNTTDTAYALEVREAGELDASFVKTFRPETINGQNGKVVHTGFTFITEEELKLLTTKTRFNRYVEKGLFKLFDELPEEVLTLDDKYANLLKENALLKSGGELEALRAEIATLREENTELKKAQKEAQTEAQKEAQKEGKK